MNEAVVILDSLLSEGEQEGAPKALERCQEEMKLVLTVLKPVVLSTAEND